jgi:hypothetical protein
MIEPTAQEGKELSYDLRQIYANELVGEHLKDIARARKSDNYSSYFKCMQDLFIITQFKWKDKEYIYVEEQKTNKVKAIERYDQLKKRFITIANENKTDFQKVTNDKEKIFKIESALNEIEKFLYEMLDEVNMFGNTWEDDGL